MISPAIFFVKKYSTYVTKFWMAPKQGPNAFDEYIICYFKSFNTIFKGFKWLLLKIIKRFNMEYISF